MRRFARAGRGLALLHVSVAAASRNRRRHALRLAEQHGRVGRVAPPTRMPRAVFSSARRPRGCHLITTHAPRAQWSLLTESSRPFAIDGIHGTGPASVGFDLMSDSFYGAMQTETADSPRGDGALLVIRQTGRGHRWRRHLPGTPPAQHAATRLGIPVISGAVLEFEGHVSPPEPIGRP